MCVLYLVMLLYYLFPNCFIERYISIFLNSDLSNSKIRSTLDRPIFLFFLKYERYELAPFLVLISSSRPLAWLAVQ